MHDHKDQEEFWREIGKALGFICTIIGALSLVIMALALISLAID